MSPNDRPPYFPFYPDHFACDGVVEAMTTEEVGAYILLLCKAWREEPAGSIPSDDGVLARWARLSPEVWERCKPGVLRAFTARNGRLYQKRLESEFAKFRATTRRKSQHGKAAAEARWKKDGRNSNPQPPLYAGALPMHCPSNADAVPNDAKEEKDKELKPPPNPPAGGNGVCGKREGKAERPRSPLAGVLIDELRDTGRLRERILALVAAGIIPNTENDRLNCVAAAERALELATNPVAMWINLVRTKRWGVLSGEQVDRAKARIAAWMAENRPPLPPVVTGLAERLSESTANEVPFPDDEPPPGDDTDTEVTE